MLNSNQVPTVSIEPDPCWSERNALQATVSLPKDHLQLEVNEK